MPQTSAQPGLRQQARDLITPPVRRELGAAALVAVICVLAAAAVLNLWAADLRVPFQYPDDANLNQLVIKSVLDHGWYQQNPDLNAPYGQELYDFPVVAGDNLSIEIVKFLGLFSSDSAVVMNVFYLLTFSLIGLSAYLVMRLLGLSRRVAVLCAVLYALIPYRFERGEIHLWLAAYYGVPLGAYLALAPLLGVRLFELRPTGARWLRWASPRSLLVLAACAVVASAQVYFAAFALILIAATTVLAFVIRRDTAALAAGAAVIAAIGAVTLLHHVPTLLYRADNGKNEVIERRPADTERYGLKLTRMVLPVSEHRVPSLAKLSDRYARTQKDQLYEGPSQALGLAATIGFLWLLWIVLASVLGRGPGPPERAARPLAALTLIAVVVATVGGVSALIGHLLTPELRSWARMVVFIAFFSLVGLGLLLERVPAIRRGAGGLAILAAVGVLAVLDQTTPRHVPDYDAVAAEYAEEGAFVGGIEQTLPPRAALFQLPYQPFPEPQALPDVQPRIGPYSLARGYLHSTSLRWSYGGIKGRNRDWQGRLVQLPLALVLPQLVGAGFQGIYIDGFGYEDGGERVVSDLADALDAQPNRSSRGRFAFFDLRAYALETVAKGGPPALTALRRAALSPVYATPSRGFGPSEEDGLMRFWRLPGRAEIDAVNTGSEPRRVRFEARLEGDAPEGAVRIRYPGGSEATVEVGSGQERVRQDLTLAPGRGTIRLEVVAGDPARPMRLVEPRLVDDAVAALVPGPSPYAPPDRQTPFGLR